MPYTLAHLPFVIPLARRRWRVVSALILGSMAPDLEYYLRMDLRTGRLGHMGWGVLGFSLPAALLALWVFHAWIKAPALALLPARHRVVLAPYAGDFRFRPAHRFLAITGSALLGLGLHLFLDMVTHPDGWSGAPLGVMEYPLIRYGAGTVALSDVLHLGVSALGVIAAWAWYRRWIRRQAPPAAGGQAGWRTWPRRWRAALRRGDPRVRVLAPMAGVALTFGLAHGVTQAEALDTYRQWRTLAGRCLVGGTTVFMFQFTVFGVLWRRSPALRALVGAATR